MNNFINNNINYFEMYNHEYGRNGRFSRKMIPENCKYIVINKN